MPLIPPLLEGEGTGVRVGKGNLLVFTQPEWEKGWR